jgi:hypothetical protein
MVNYKPISTPMNTHAKVSTESRPPVANPTHFRSLVGALQDLTFTHSDITYTVQQICLHMHDPREAHLTAMKHTLCHLRDTLDYGLLLRSSASSELMVYTDVDWVGCPTRRSISGYVVFLGTNLVSWFEASERHLPLKCRGRIPGHGQWRGRGLRDLATTSGAPHSTDEEHPHLLRQREHHLPLHQLHSAPVHKTCRDRPPFCAERVAIDNVCVLHVPTISQFTNTFMKGLPTSVFSEFWSILNIRSG